MTSLAATSEPSAPAQSARLPLALFASGFLTLSAFYLPLAVVPVLAPAAAGVLLLASVAAEIVGPWVCARVGYRWALLVALLLMGVPALATSALVVGSALRGFGFGLAMVAGGAWVVSLLPADRRGAGLAAYGVVVSVPSFLALPAGVWLAAAYGPSAVLQLTFVVATLALVGLVAPLPAAASEDAPHGLTLVLRDPELLGRAALFAATTVVVGIVTSFLPLVVGAAHAGLAALALFVHAAVSTAARWGSGVLSDRRPAAVRLAPCLALCAVGTALLAFAPSAVWVMAGVIIFSLGFGAAQNAALLPMLARVSPGGYAAVSAAWDLAYDGGMAIGALGFGVAASAAGWPAAFVAVALLVGAVGLAGRRL